MSNRKGDVDKVGQEEEKRVLVCRLYSLRGERNSKRREFYCNTEVKNKTQKEEIAIEKFL